MNTTSNTECWADVVTADGIVRKPGQRWRNTTTDNVILPLREHCEWSLDGRALAPITGKPNLEEPKKGTVHVVPWTVTITPGQEVVLPAEMTPAIEQRGPCKEPGCKRGIYCRDLSHPADVVGGLGGGRLQRVSTSGVVTPPTMHPSLTAPAAPAPATQTDSDLDARLMAKVNAARTAARAARGPQ